MALVKMGVAVSQISGSIAGTTFARNRAGAYMRNRTTPLNPQSPRQTAVRATLANLANIWTQTLTQAQRDGWNQYAAQVPLQNRLGQQFFASGINMYARGNALLLDAGGVRRDEAPASFTQGPSFTPTLAVVTAGATITITDLGGIDLTAEPVSMLLSQGITQGAGVNFFAGPFRKIDGTAYTLGTPVLPVVAIPSVFPFIAGQVVFLRSRMVTVDGRVGPAVVQRFLAA